MAEENETRVEILLDICKDLTEEHIIKACELYKDELTKNYKNEVNYIAYKNNLYRMKPTIRYANDEILKNTNKLNVPKYKSGGEYNIVADDFKRFFDIKFENAKQIQLIKFGEQEKDTTQIDFENLLLWFNEYAGRKHSKDNTEETKLGRQIREEFIKYAKRILENQSDFVMESCSQWQNSGNIKHYLWIQFKHKKHKYKPYSISLGMSKNAENEPKIYIKTEIVNNTATKEIYKNFAKTLNVNVPDGFKIYDENYNVIDNQEVAKQKISNSEIQKVMIEKEISTPYLNERTDEIIKESVSIFNKIEPNYLAIFKDKEDSKMDKTAKNLILYGPPGTGKTYNTIIESLRILEPENEEYKKETYTNEEYEKLQHIFEQYKEKRQIEFVTFHQSYSYEEFVEGIKPDLDSENLIYELKEGVFKQICEHAEVKFSDNFDEIYTKFLDEIDSAEGLFKLTTRKYKKEFGLEINSNNNLNIYMGNDFHKQGTLTKENIQRHFLQTRTQSDWSGYYDGIIDYLKEKYKLEKQDKKAQPHVLIIDEINRGNISKIFGELITLIEDDKRGKLKVRLPYSPEPFTVPENLYIIGTMNTSDRSIASVDIALRRRFKFKEMMPKPGLVADFGCKFEDKFKILNKKISILLDRDHQIGHSYFIKDKYKNADIDVLQNIWFDSIMPLLNEYFYGDWEKLQEILGAAENEKGHNENSKYFSFIKKLDNDCIKTSCYDATTDCFDFVREDEVDFDTALNRAFSIKAQEQK